MDMIQDSKGLYQCSRCGRYYHKDELNVKEDKLYGKVIGVKYVCPNCKGIAVLAKDHRFAAYTIK